MRSRPDNASKMLTRLYWLYTATACPSGDGWISSFDKRCHGFVAWGWWRNALHNARPLGAVAHSRPSRPVE